MNRYFLAILMTIITINLFGINFDKEIDQWLNQEITPTAFLEELNRAEKNLTDTSGPELYYQKSQIDLYRGMTYFFIDDEDYSIKHLEQSITNSERAIEMQPQSDYYRVLSEAGSYLMLQKGLSYIIKNSKAVNQNALTALELDPNNIKAEIIVANGLINAPRLFGGNPKKGIKILNRLIEVKTITNQDKFNALLALGKEEEDKDYINKALEIYPNNQRAKDLLNSL